MTIDEAKQYIREHATEHLQPDGTGKGFVCPICKSGTGKHGTGIQQAPDKIHFTCFAKHCFSNADIIDIIGLENHIPLDNAHFIERLKASCKAFNITLDDNTPFTPIKKKEHETMREQRETPQTDYTEYYKKCNADVSKTDYWSKRGISQQTVDRFLLGYDTGTNSIVIPIDKYTFKRRRTDVKQFYNSKGGAMQLYNPQAINNDVVFICESETDALSIEELNKPALAIRGTSNTKLVTELIKGLTKEETDGKTLLLCLDIDNAGDKATADLQKQLNGLVSCIDIRPLFAGYEYTDTEGNARKVKDINELLVYYRDNLNALITLTVEQITSALQGVVKSNYVNSNSASAFINEFLNGVKDSVNTPPIKTGYNNLDEYLDGGLYEGLYTIGAISSLGKTTFLLQMADNIASSGNDVLIFSLEMTRAELIAKSISRNTYTFCLEKNIPINPNAKTNISITNGTKYDTYTETELYVIEQAIKRYKVYSKHIFIYDNDLNKRKERITVYDIEDIIKNHIAITGTRPVVIIDYLQILGTPDNQRFNDNRLKVNNDVTRLKSISNTYKIPVITVSSFNRTNYSTAVTYEAFKESGEIEYTSNAIFGLQLKGVAEATAQKPFDVNKAKARNPRNIELVVLKNRNGKTGGTLNYDYYAMFNYFEDTDGEKTVQL